jgi:hypothetical protein
MCLFLGAAAGALGGAAGGISALSAVMGIAQMGIGIMQANAQNQAIAADYQEKVRFRNEQYTQAQKTLNEQVAQQSAALESEKAKAQGEKAEASIKGYAAESRAMTGAAESGIVGLSVDALVGSIRSEEARFTNKVDYNSKVAGYNAGNELKMAKRGAQARLAEIPIPAKPKFNTGLQIATAALSGLSTAMG